jgi:hypothetical protein
MATLLQGGGPLKLHTDVGSTPTIQNLVPRIDSLRMRVTNPNTNGSITVVAVHVPGGVMRLTTALPYLERATTTSKESLIAPYRPFKHWDGNAWVDVVSWRYDGTRWVGLPWHIYHGGTWRM